MPLFRWLGDLVDKTARNQDRNLSRFGLHHIIMFILAAVGWLGWLSKDQSGSSFGGALKTSAILALCALPLILFLLLGPLNMARAMSDLGVMKQIAVAIGPALAFMISVAVLVVMYPFARFSHVPEMRQWAYAHVGFEQEISSFQLLAAAALSYLLYAFLAQLLALRGSSLRGPEYRTHYRGLTDAVRLGYRGTRGVVMFVPKTVKAARNAPPRFRGARDTKDTVSTGGLGDLVNGNVGREAPLQSPAQRQPDRPVAMPSMGPRGFASAAQASMASVTPPVAGQVYTGMPRVQPTVVHQMGPAPTSDADNPWRSQEQPAT
jgi:hypothetical protein